MSNFASVLVPSSGTCPDFIGVGGNRGKYIYESYWIFIAENFLIYGMPVVGRSGRAKSAASFRASGSLKFQCGCTNLRVRAHLSSRKSLKSKKSHFPHLSQRGSKMRKFTFRVFFVKFHLFASQRVFSVKMRKNERNESDLFLERGLAT